MADDDFFGHAAYLGIGGYAVGISTRTKASARDSFSGRCACGVGAVRARHRPLSLRHSRVYFIMITLASRRCILRRIRACPLRRGRRPDDLQAQRFRRPHICRAACNLLFLPRLSVRRIYLIWRIVNSASAGVQACAPTEAAHAGHRVSANGTGLFASSSRGTNVWYWPVRCRQQHVRQSRRDCYWTRSGI